MSITAESAERYGRRQLLIAQFWTSFAFLIFPLVVGLIFILPGRQPTKPDGIAWPPGDSWFAPISIPVAAIALLFLHGAWFLVPILIRTVLVILTGGIILVLPGTWEGISNHLPLNTSRCLLALAAWWLARGLVAAMEPTISGSNRWITGVTTLLGALVAIIPVSESDQSFWPKVWAIWFLGLIIETSGFVIRVKSLALQGKPIS
jgi:hypothetical protein